MIRHPRMGNIHRPSNYGGRGPETGAFIQCINGLDPQIHKLLCWDINRICLEVHPTACVMIPTGINREFVTEYLSENGWRYQIIGEFSINRSVQFIEISEV